MIGLATIAMRGVGLGIQSNTADIRIKNGYKLSNHYLNIFLGQVTKFSLFYLELNGLSSILGRSAYVLLID